MKAKQIIRLILWSLLFITCFSFAVIGFTKKKTDYRNNTQIEEEYSSIEEILE